MFFLNLSAAEFLSLLGVLGGLVTALYLLDRAKRRKVVSTLRFWSPATASEQSQNRRRMSDPWSLILQLASLALLLLAIAQVQWGGRQSRGRDHVLLLDTSAWAAARSASGPAKLLDQEKAAARRFLANLPASDRVMLVAADSLATPLTPFTPDRAELSAALQAVDAGWSALDADHVLAFAQQAQDWSGGAAGDIVYIGPHLTRERAVRTPPPNLRVISLAADRDNQGIRQLSLKQVEDEPDNWLASVRIRNDAPGTRVVHLDLRCGGVRFSPRTMTLSSGEERSADYRFVMKGTGDLVATLSAPDALASDNRALVHIPGANPLRIAIYTDRAEQLRPLLEANRQIHPRFLSFAEYQPRPAAEMMILDRFAPPRSPALPALWIDPPGGRSPLPVERTVSGARITDWLSSSGAALRGRDLRLPEAEVFQLFDGDQAVARVAEGAIVAVRPGSATSPRTAVVGFDPENEHVRFDVSIPLLFANLLEWLAPESFLSYEVTADRVGLSQVAIEPGVGRDQLRVEDEAGARLPYTLRQNSLQLFSARPANIKVISPERERRLSLSLPDVADHEWRIPPAAAQGLPPRRLAAASAVDIWKWLALLGAAGLLSEWLLFGPGRLARRRARSAAPGPAPARYQGDLVAK